MKSLLIIVVLTGVIVVASLVFVYRQPTIDDPTALRLCGIRPAVTVRISSEYISVDGGGFPGSGPTFYDHSGKELFGCYPILDNDPRCDEGEVKSHEASSKIVCESDLYRYEHEWSLEKMGYSMRGFLQDFLYKTGL